MRLETSENSFGHQPATLSGMTMAFAFGAIHLARRVVRGADSEASQRKFIRCQKTSMCRGVASVSWTAGMSTITGLFLMRAHAYELSSTRLRGVANRCPATGIRPILT